jgi:hypothetical protein
VTTELQVLPDADRSQYLGGSDMIHLTASEPWGCRRRLYYDKFPVPADFPFTGNIHTRRGKKLEAICVEEYLEATGRMAVRHPFRRQKRKPWRSVHLDRRLYDKKDGPFAPYGPGVLEAKCPARDGFWRIKTAGIPLDYEMQCQWGMAVTGWLWGAVVVFHADSMGLVYKDYKRDEEFCKELLKYGDSFYAEVLADRADEFRKFRHIPHALPPGDKRCFTCPWRKTCQGMGMTITELFEEEQLPDVPIEPDPSLEDLARELLETTEIRLEAEKIEEAVKDNLKELMGTRLAVDTGHFEVFLANINVKEHVRKAHAQKRIRVKPKKTK